MSSNKDTTAVETVVVLKRSGGDFHFPMYEIPEALLKKHGKIVLDPLPEVGFVAFPALLRMVKNYFGI